MSEHITASEAASEITAATKEFAAAATEITVKTAGFTAAAASEMARFYIECTQRAIQLCDEKRKELQDSLGTSADSGSSENK